MLLQLQRSQQQDGQQQIWLQERPLFPSSFLSTTVSPKIPQKSGTIGYHLPGSQLGVTAGQWLGKRMEGSQAKERGVWARTPPSPWAGQGLRGLLGLWSLVLSS